MLSKRVLLCFTIITYRNLPQQRRYGGPFLYFAASSNFLKIIIIITKGYHNVPENATDTTACYSDCESNYPNDLSDQLACMTNPNNSDRARCSTDLLVRIYFLTFLADYRLPVDDYFVECCQFCEGKCFRRISIHRGYWITHQHRRYDDNYQSRQSIHV